MVKLKITINHIRFTLVIFFAIRLNRLVHKKPIDFFQKVNEKNIFSP